jgi:hypothetical protein
MEFVWRCRNCNFVCVSRSDELHKTDFCKCGKVGVDFGAYYKRIIGESDLCESIVTVDRDELIIHWKKKTRVE